MNEKQTLSTFLEAQGYASLQMHKNVIGHFEVQGHIENKEVLLLVDTGASNTVVDARSAETLGLHSIATEEKAGGFGTTEGVTAHTAVNTLQIGSLNFPSFTLYILDLEYCNAGIEANGGQRMTALLEPTSWASEKLLLIIGKRSSIFGCDLPYRRRPLHLVK